MQVEDKVLEKLSGLPMDRKLEVLDFAEFLETKEQKPRNRRSVIGSLEHLDLHFTLEDLREARREMWPDLDGSGSP